MNRKVILTIVIGLLVIAAAVGVGFTAFRMGQAYGISQSPAIATAIANRPEGSAPVPFAGGPGMYGFGFGMDRPFGGPFGGGFAGHWGPGPAFGFLRCLIPLFLLFLVFAFFRLVFRPWGWRGGWGGHGGPWGRGRWGHDGPDGQPNVPPMFEEWHKRAHGETPPTPPTDTPPSTNA